MTQERAMFGAGCFWGLEATFRQVPGVADVAVGYAGGHMKSPTYDDVCTGKTGHAEVVDITFDPAVVSYEALLDVLWKNHNPTTLNRQGPDIGTQYRSAIFYYNDGQHKAAKRSRNAIADAGVFRKPIVTEISAAQPFYRGEEYHQRYLEKRGLAHCHAG
jgi:peptide-methionine (S)-S-oxide reductase